MPIFIDSLFYYSISYYVCFFFIQNGKGEIRSKAIDALREIITKKDQHFPPALQEQIEKLVDLVIRTEQCEDASTAREIEGILLFLREMIKQGVTLPNEDELLKAALRLEEEAQSKEEAEEEEEKDAEQWEAMGNAADRLAKVLLKRKGKKQRSLAALIRVTTDQDELIARQKAELAESSIRIAKQTKSPSSPPDSSDESDSKLVL